MTIQERIQTVPAPESEPLPEVMPLEEMSTKRMIQIELDLMTEEQLMVAFNFIEDFMQTQPLREGATIMEKLRRMPPIDAPPDFSTHWERYLGEEADTESVVAAIAKETQP